MSEATEPRLCPSMTHADAVAPIDPVAVGHGFDRLIFTSILQKALCERDERGGRLADRVGISGTALGILLMLNVPGHPMLAPEDYVASKETEEQGWVRELLVESISTELELSHWLAAAVARRAMEAGHLWEDLGLPDRSALNALMLRHFAPLAERNKNMRWKRFFYRMLCEKDGLSHCTSPVCGDCPDVEQCFEPDSAEAAIARAKRLPD